MDLSEHQRQYIMILTLAELLERALTSSVFAYTPSEHLDTEHTPSFVFSGIVPASGGTLIERPVLWTSSNFGRELGEPPQPDDIIEGFEVTERGDTLVIGKGKYRKAGEIKEFAGATVKKPPEDKLVTFNLLTEQIEITAYVSPFHRVLK